MAEELTLKEKIGQDGAASPETVLNTRASTYTWTRDPSDPQQQTSEGELSSAFVGEDSVAGAVKAAPPPPKVSVTVPLVVPEAQPPQVFRTPIFSEIARGWRSFVRETQNFGAGVLQDLKQLGKNTADYWFSPQGISLATKMIAGGQKGIQKVIGGE